MKRSILIAACAAVLLNACEPSKTADSGVTPKSSGTEATSLESKGPTPTLAPVDAVTQERIDTLRKRQADHLKAEPVSGATPSPATGN